MCRTTRLRSATLLLVLLAASTAAAQESRSVLESESPAVLPARYVLTLSAGVPLRLTQNVDYDQGTTAPLFGDVVVGYVLPGDGVHRQGFGLGASMNLSDDGGYTEPVAASDQIVLMPAYLGFWDLDADLFALGHLGVPFLIGGGDSAGLELAFALGYRLRAGAGLFAELGVDAFVGASSTLHPSVSAEAGIFVDYEVLP